MLLILEWIQDNIVLYIVYIVSHSIVLDLNKVTMVSF